MAINYVALTRRVRKLLAKNGAPYNVTRKGLVYRNNIGDELKEDDRVYSAIGIMTSFSIYEMTGSVIQAGDMKFICVVPPTEVMEIGDILDVNGTLWRVEDPKPVMPNATAMCYIAQVRLI
ncbi:MAG: hypothetical protein [Bacteriophage sp.]|nr:MAG: hypothetical protein [Bacteriophage sp.]